MVDYSRHLAGGTTQFDRTDPKQVQNSSGAYVFDVGPFERLERFLILGAEGGTYYATERQLTRENAASLTICLDQDADRAVRTIVEISQWGRAPKQGPAIFAMAIAASHPKQEARSLALAALPLVCRTGRHLLEFVAAVDSMRGWGTRLRRAVGEWYTVKGFDALAYQLTKYRGSGKDAKRWTHRDILRKAHPSPVDLDGGVRAALRWAVGGEPGERHVKRNGKERAEWQASCGDLPERLAAFDVLQRADNVPEVVRLINEYAFTHEMVPSQFKKEAAVWEALARRMPLGALVRNLGKLSSLGLLAQRSEWAKTVTGRLTDVGAIRRARLHPIAFLSAMLVYRGGHALQGGFVRRGKTPREPMTWTAAPEVTAALESAFYLAFGNVNPTGKRLLLALDVSSSMQSGTIAGVPGLTPAMATAAMALVTLRTDPASACFGFSHRFEELKIKPDMSLESAMKRTRDVQFGATDCALPFRWALTAGVKGPLEVDGFVVYTDNETNQSTGHPYQELGKYRQRTGIPARLAVAAFTSNSFTIADPNDVGMLDVVGFDSAAPAVISDFLRGKRIEVEPNPEAQNDDADETEAA